MTKKLIWRLKEQPTSESLQGLVSTGLLTKDEAREILFNLQEEGERDIKSLEEEIKFLRDIIDKLSRNNYSGTITIIKEIEKPYSQRPWYGPYNSWSNSDLTTLCSNTDSINNMPLSFNSIQTF